MEIFGKFMYFLWQAARPGGAVFFLMGNYTRLGDSLIGQTGEQLGQKIPAPGDSAGIRRQVEGDLIGLFHQIGGYAHVVDLVQLGFQPVDVGFLILQIRLEQGPRAVITQFNADLDAFIISLDRA